jgi:hypothetical protein
MLLTTRRAVNSLGTLNTDLDQCPALCLTNFERKLRERQPSRTKMRIRLLRLARIPELKLKLPRGSELVAMRGSGRDPQESKICKMTVSCARKMLLVCGFRESKDERQAVDTMGYSPEKYERRRADFLPGPEIRTM